VRWSHGTGQQHGVLDGRGLVFIGSERGVGRVAAWSVINGRWWRPVLMAIKGGLDYGEMVGHNGGVKSGLYRAMKERIEGREARETRGGGQRQRC
jgi:hypothetical protein